MNLSKFTVEVDAIFDETPDIRRYELIDPAGVVLPAFSAGAHIYVHLKEGMVRQYSLSNDPLNRGCYEIAVLRETDGRGGSEAIHTNLQKGTKVIISEPRNNFPLKSESAFHLFLAGGVGVTPMMAMIAELDASGAQYHMHYCTRTLKDTAFHDRLVPLLSTGQVTLHHDGGNPAHGIDLAATLRGYEFGTHLYCCGPQGFMAAVKAAAEHWPSGTVHFEYFTAQQDEFALNRENTPFKVKIDSTGQVFDVAVDQTIIEVLRVNGFAVDTECEDGYCGTCITRYVDGEPEHRDLVLDDEDRNEFVMVCCARSRSPVLVLDM